MNFRHTFASLSFAAILATAFAEENPTIFPYQPAQLLTVLPTAPAEWKTLRSDADLTLGEWLETRATRTFQAPVPPPTPDGGTATEVTPGEIEISVVDSAGSASTLAAFADFAPAKIGSLEKKRIGSLPAIITTSENGQRFAQILVSSRYLIELKLTNLPRHRLEDWLQLFHFDSLPPVSQAPATRPREFRLTHIDELQPRNNRSYVVSTTNVRRLDAFLKTLPPSPAEE